MSDYSWNNILFQGCASSKCGSLRLGMSDGAVLKPGEGTILLDLWVDLRMRIHKLSLGG